MTKEENAIFGEEQTASIRERLYKYLAYWPLFLICVMVAVAAGMLYIRNTQPKYMATSSFLVKGIDGGSSSSGDLIESAISGKREVNLNNEMLLIRSANLMARTVAKNNFNISYFIKGRILNTDVYKDAPFTLVATQLTDSNKSYYLEIKNIHVLGGSFLYGFEKEQKLHTFRWNEPFTVDGQVFVLIAKRRIGNEAGQYIVRWQPIYVTAGELSNNLVVRPFDAKTSVIELAIKIENVEKGKDVLNALFAEFNQSNIEDRNELSRSTVQFIDERLSSISQELKGVEGNLENYQGSNQLTDIKGQSSQSLENANDVSKTIKGLAIQQGVASMILDYFNNPVNSNKLVPSSLGLSDPTLASLISQYNELQLKKEREAPLVAPNSTVMQDLNTQNSNLRSSILESLNNLTKNLKFQERNFQEQNSRYKNFLSSVPHNERVMQEIKRKQSITEGLYLYLLQKREEAAISSTGSNVPHYKQIDLAVGFGPIEPNTRNIYIYTALLGLFLAFGWIYLSNLLNDKVKSREDIVNRTPLSILGQISHISKEKKQAISILDRNIIGEQFRSIRTNLSFLLKDKNKKTILITSSVTGEGKSFISLNLAGVFAMPGKKVALLEFDIRKPAIGNNLKLNNTKGITDFLTGEVKDISDISHSLSEIPGLHVYPSGPIPFNPADLLLSENMSRLFEALKAKYDYVIVDSAPAGLVSDPFILAEYSDIIVYIIRSQKTSKKQLDFVTEKAANKTFHNVTLIINDIKKSDDTGYGYGYGGDYTYGYGNTNGVSKKRKKISWMK